jgi:hypothetical protein
MADAVAEVLAATFEVPVQLDGEEHLGGNRSRVVCYHIRSQGGDVPRSVVVQHAIAQAGESYDPTASGGPAERLFNDWAGLQFLSEVLGTASPAPRFYGGDRTAGFIVMEDLGTGIGLHEALLESRNAARAEDIMVAYFGVLGRVHAATIGRKERFTSLRDALGPRGASHISNMSGPIRDMHATLERLHVSPAAGFAGEVTLCGTFARDPGPFDAYIQADPCPDNCLSTATGLRLLDFEYAQFGPALWDGAYARAQYMTCWCANRVPDHVVARAEAAYRAELMEGCPPARDDAQFYRALTMAAACSTFWLLSQVMRELLANDWTTGIATQRQACSCAWMRWGGSPSSGAISQP